MDNILEAALSASEDMDKLSQRKELVQNIVDADDITQKQITFMLKKDVFGTGPRNASELFQAVDVLYGRHYGTKVSEDKWTSPAEWLHAMYFDTYPQLLGVAPRGAGKTEAASIITHFKCHHKPGYEATHLGARLEQAQVAQRYLANFQNDSILNEGMESIGLKKAKWNNGSLWMIVAGTMAGVSGQHPSMLSIDELEFLDAETLEQTWANPMDKNGYKRFWTGFSTRQRACLPGHTRIITEDGPKMIRDIVNQKYSGRVKSYNFETNTWEWNQVINWFNNGKTDQWYHVNLEFPTMGIGGAVTSTIEHQYMRPDGSKTCLRDLTPGDEICIEGYVFDDAQHQVMLGGMLGDSSMSIDGQLCMSHSHHQESYLRWKYDVFGDLTSEVYHYAPKNHYSFQVSRTLATHRIRRDWYANGKKNIPSEVWDTLTPLGVAVWFMDDGNFVTTKHGSKYWQVYAMHFEENERQECKQYFEKLGIIGNWFQLGKTGKTARTQNNWVFRFSAKESMKITALLAPYISVETYLGKGLGWKTWIADMYIGHNEPVLCPVAISSITPANLCESVKYDITVDRTHNYQVYSGVLVSNSGLMNILTQQAESGEKNIKLMQWSVFEVMQPCRECLCIKGGNVISEPEKACPLWKYCHGEKARKVDGWMSRESVVNLMETMTQESFETQMLCLRPSSHGLVLSTFIADYATKLDLNRGNYLNWTYQNSLPLYCWHDPADGGKSALCFVQIFGGKVFLFDELIMDGGPTIEKVKVALWEHCMAKGYSLPKFIVMDPHRAEVYGKIWQEGNPAGEGKDRSYMVEYPDMDGTGFADIEPGLELTRALICNGIGARAFFVNPIQAKGYVTAITNNRYKVDKTNIIYQGAKQEPKYKDEIDSIRYGLIHAVQRLGIAANRRMGIYF